MSTQVWPTALRPQTFSAALRKAGLQFRSPFNGTVQAVDFVAERWIFSLTLSPKKYPNAGQVEALLQTLTGGINTVQCWHFAREAPIGTMRGNPTLSSGAARGDTALSISGSGTLKAGDIVGCGGQLFMVASDTTLSGSVPMVNRIRATISNGSAVTWDKPTAYFIMPASQAFAAYRPGSQDGVAFDLEETW